MTFLNNHLQITVKMHLEIMFLVEKLIGSAGTSLLYLTLGVIEGVLINPIHPKTK